MRPEKWYLENFVLKNNIDVVCLDWEGGDIPGIKNSFNINLKPPDMKTSEHFYKTISISGNQFIRFEIYVSIWEV